MSDNKKRVPPHKNADLAFNPFDVGKLPPQAPDLEEAVLGALMIQKNALSEIISFVKSECFYVDAHSRIYDAILNLYNAKKPIDILTVTNQLKSTAELEIVGGAYYVSKLTNRVASGANIVFHSRIIYQKYLQREIIRVSSNAIKEAYKDETDVFDLLEYMQHSYSDLSTISSETNYKSIADLYKQHMKWNDELILKQGIAGVPSGFIDIDKITGGWQKTDLITIGARPGMGKTAFLLSMCRNAAVIFKKPIAFFSLEMSALQLFARFGSSETEIHLGNILRKGLQGQELEEFKMKMQNSVDAPLYIDDTPALSIFDFRNKVKKMIKELNIELIALDYVQLMTIGSEITKHVKVENRVGELSYITKNLKAIAKEFNVPIVILSQLNRQVEARADKRPGLADLREGGTIEQDSDLVAFLYRPEYYGIELDAEDNSTEGFALLDIAKHRNGALEEVGLTFESEFTKFKDRIKESEWEPTEKPNIALKPSDEF